MAAAPLDRWTVAPDSSSSSESQSSSAGGAVVLAASPSIATGAVVPTRGLGPLGQRQRGRPKGTPGNPAQRRAIKVRETEVAALRVPRSNQSRVTGCSGVPVVALGCTYCHINLIKVLNIV